MSKNRKISLVLFIIYTGFILWVTIFSREPDYSITYGRSMWKSYSYYYFSYGDTKLIPNLVLNIALFVPFGFLFSIFFNKPGIIAFVVIVISSALFSFFIEITQFYYSLGRFEIDDIINNSLGAFIGFLIYLIAYNIFKKKDALG